VVPESWQASSAWVRLWSVIAAVLAICTPALGQELEPRAYSASPIGTNFLVVSYSHLYGDVLTDPASVVQNVQASIQLYLIGYAYTFGLAGRQASIGIVMPYAREDVSGDVLDSPTAVYRAGWGDLRLRFAMNLYGSPALTPREFAQREQRPALGASVSVVAPTGQYVSSRLVNVGTNRWAVKPELGFSYPHGNAFFELSGGAWFFGDNSDYLGGKRRSQNALYAAQVHTGYNFGPGLWLAVNAGYVEGGGTTVDAVRNNDEQSYSRYGATLSIPFGDGWSGKVAWSKGFVTRGGGDYKMITLALQYRWFDR
jgi:hypothetical protein